MSKIAEIIARYKAATPGPWIHQEGKDGKSNYISNVDGIEICVGYYKEERGDMKFLANAPTDIKTLLDKLVECRPWIEALIDFEKMGFIVVEADDDGIGSLEELKALFASLPEAS